MATKKKNLRVRIDLTAKEAERFLKHFGLEEIFTYMVNDAKLEHLYVAVRDLEKTEFPKTMTSRTKTKRNSFFKDFDEFKKTFEDFVTRFLVSQFLDEFSKFPFRAPNVIVERLDVKKAELLEWAITYSFADLQAEIHIDMINRGHQPFNIFE